ncbi:Kinesin light chain [Seminavis robusta]|uniref:Kinesin light chain n=1 Tax=Seminavis robusta TaxID=568900 RepID=A0A9N8D7R7_9STRA|nr:Kinesin light chain [Seminavis robusta]|eukprot:Sro32_g020620.1 Kinesin light chain (1622) ;mRNA; r:16720-21955
MSSSWTCVTCTFADNPVEFLTCSVCGTPQASVAACRANWEKTEQQPPSACQDDCWVCQVCTFAGNSKNQSQCIMCNEVSESPLEERAEEEGPIQAASLDTGDSTGCNKIDETPSPGDKLGDPPEHRDAVASAHAASLLLEKKAREEEQQQVSNQDTDSSGSANKETHLPSNMKQHGASPETVGHAVPDLSMFGQPTVEQENSALQQRRQHAEEELRWLWKLFSTNDNSDPVSPEGSFLGILMRVLHLALVNQKVRNELVLLDAFEPLLLAFQSAQNKTEKVLSALIVAVLVDSDPSIWNFTHTRQRLIEACLTYLDGLEAEVGLVDLGPGFADFPLLSELLPDAKTACSQRQALCKTPSGNDDAFDIHVRFEAAFWCLKEADEKHHFKGREGLSQLETGAIRVLGLTHSAPGLVYQVFPLLAKAVAEVNRDDRLASTLAAVAVVYTIPFLADFMLASNQENINTCIKFLQDNPLPVQGDVVYIGAYELAQKEIDFALLLARGEVDADGVDAMTWISSQKDNLHALLCYLQSPNETAQLAAASALMKLAEESQNTRQNMRHFGACHILKDLHGKATSKPGVQVCLELIALRLLEANSFIAWTLNLSIWYVDVLENLIHHSRVDVMSNQQYGWLLEKCNAGREGLAWHHNRFLKEKESVLTIYRRRFFPITTSTMSPSQLYNARKPATGTEYDLTDIYQRKDAVALLRLYGVGSIRVLDASLVLLALVESSKEARNRIRECVGEKILLAKFPTQVDAQSELLRATVSLILDKLSEEGYDLELTAEQTSRITYDTASLAFRVRGKIQNIFSDPSGLVRLSPTMHGPARYIGVATVVLLTSLGVSLQSTSNSTKENSIYFHDMVSCRTLEDATRVCIQCKETAFTLSFGSAEAAAGLVEDVNSRFIVAEKTKSDPAEALRVHNVAFADDPEFLGVSAYHLKSVFLTKVVDTKGLSTRSKFYEVENLFSDNGFVREQGAATVCPVDGRCGSAYVHTLAGEDHVGPATLMLSWTWSYTVKDVVETIDEFCRKNKFDRRRTYIWICCLCLNQHRIVESNKSGMADQKALDFEAAFRSRVVAVGRVISMSTPWENPANLRRIWCLYEIFICLQESVELSIVMPPRQSDRFAIQFFKCQDSLFQALCNVDVERAEASVESDRDTILELVREGKGFAEVNSSVREHMRAWVRGVMAEIVSLRQNAEAANDEPLGASQAASTSFYKEAGNVYELFGDYDAALSMRKKVSSRDEPLHGLEAAEWYADVGATLRTRSWGEALGMLKKSVHLYEEELGNKSQETAKLYFQLGTLYQEMKLTLDALAYLQKALEAREESLGSNHRDTAIARCHVSVLTAEVDGTSVEDAIQKAYESLSILLAAVGPNNPDTAVGALQLCLFNSTTRRLRFGDVALDEMNKCIAIQETTIGRKHPNFAKSLIQRGEIYRLLGKLNEAEQDFQAGLGIQRATLAEGHVDIALSLAQLSVLACTRGEMDAGTGMHLRSQAIDALKAGNNAAPEAKTDSDNLFMPIRRTHIVSDVFFQVGKERLTKGFPREALLILELGVSVVERSFPSSSDMVPGYYEMVQTIREANLAVQNQREAHVVNELKNEGNQESSEKEESTTDFVLASASPHP